MSILDHALHAVAYASLRVLPPGRAHAFVVRVGSLLPQRRSVERARRAGKRLRGGTCLSRALTVSARLPNTEVVIGVGPPHALSAHAWVEVDGSPLYDDARGQEIVRLHRP